jgi:hypothetical protein
MRERHRLSSLLLWCAVTLACGGAGDRLAGSISETATLRFDEVRAEWLADQLAIRYLSAGASLSSDAARLTLLASQALPGLDIPIEGNVVVEHFWYRWDDQGRLGQEDPFPPVDHGTLRFTTVGQQLGDHVAGSFSVLFVGGDTLDGDFDAEVVEPDPG